MKRASRGSAFACACACACVVAVAVALANGACVFDYADINLVVHQSADDARRRTAPGNILEVTYVLDPLAADGTLLADQRQVDGFSFDENARTESLPQRLKPNAQRMTMALAVGGGAGFPLADAFAVGRVDPLLVPSVDDGPVTLEAHAFLAAPDAIEPLDAAVPAGGTQAVCDNRAGFVHAVGSVAAYSFDLDDLALVSNEAAFVTEAGAAIACDVTDVLADGVRQDSEGAVVAAHGVCVAGARHTVVLDVGGPREVVLENQQGELCDPFVRVVTLADGSSRVWVATRTFASLYALGIPGVEDGKLLGNQPFNPFLTGPVRHVLLDDGTLIASGALDDADGNRIGTIITRSESDDALQPAEPTRGLDAMLAGDPSGQTALFAEDDGTFTLRLPSVAGGVVSYEGDDKQVTFAEGFVPARILVLRGDDDDRDNDIVVGMNEVGAVQIEGGRVHENTSRNAFAIAFGRAIVLAGNAPGHDVLVRPFDDDEIELLETRTPSSR